MKYDEAFNKKDADAVAALYTVDAVYVAQHGTSHGRQAIEKTYNGFLKKGLFAGKPSHVFDGDTGNFTAWRMMTITLLCYWPAYV
jgi:uncharacterized protein (TIGR02246 family)